MQPLYMQRSGYMQRPRTTYRFSAPIRHLLLFMLIPGLFFADILYGITHHLGIPLPVSPGFFLRGLLFLFMSIQVVMYLPKLPSAFSSLLFVLVILTLPGLMVSTIDLSSSAVMVTELEAMCKVLFGPVMGIWFMLLINKWNLPFEILLKYLEYSFYFLGLALLLMQLTDYTVSTYSLTKGTKGLFAPVNEISLSLGLAMVAAVTNNLMRYNPLRVVFLLCSTYALLSLGTRSSLIVAVGVPVVVFIMLIFSNNDNWKRKHVFRMLIFSGPLLVATAIYAGYSFYQSYSEDHYSAKKYASTLAGETPRAFSLNAANQHIKNRNALFNLFGEGVTKFQRGVFEEANDYGYGSRENKSQVETGWMDLFGQYGPFFMLLLHALFIFMLFQAIKQWLQTRDPTHGVQSIMLTIYMGHSALAGHAFVSPTPSGLIAVVYAMILVTYRGKKRYATPILDSIESGAGGLQRR